MSERDRTMTECEQDNTLLLSAANLTYEAEHYLREAKSCVVESLQRRARWYEKSQGFQRDAAMAAAKTHLDKSLLKIVNLID